MSLHRGSRPELTLPPTARSAEPGDLRERGASASRLLPVGVADVFRSGSPWATVVTDRGPMTGYGRARSRRYARRSWWADRPSIAQPNGHSVALAGPDKYEITLDTAGGVSRLSPDGPIRAACAAALPDREATRRLRPVRAGR